MKVKCKTHLCL